MIRINAIHGKFIYDPSAYDSSLKANTMVTHSKKIGVVLAAIVALGGASLGHAEQRICDNVNVTIQFNDPGDAETGCRGAAEAIVFLGKQGFRTDMPITVRFVSRIAQDPENNMRGCFDRQTKDVIILDYGTCTKDASFNRMFGMDVGRDLFRGIVVHEVAHAIAEENFAFEDPSYVTGEYIAYVTQIATLRDDLRARVLAAHPVSGFEKREQINHIVLMMKPELFAVKSYLHFVHPDNGKHFLQDLISGKVRLIYSIP